MRGRVAIALATCVVAISPAVAADFPPPVMPQAPPVYVPVVAPLPFTWSGIYVGGNGGYGWSSWSDGQGESFTGKGGLGGGQVGFNVQINQFVVELGWFVRRTFRGAFDRALVYGKIGGAWAEEDWNSSGSVTVGGVSATASGSNSFDRYGWMVGAGVEYAVTNNLTIKAEYNLLDFGTANETLSTNAGGALFTTRWSLRNLMSTSSRLA